MMQAKAIAAVSLTYLICFGSVARAQSPALKAGTWAGEVVTKISGPLAANPLAIAAAKPIPLRKCISLEVANRGLIGFVTDECRLEHPQVSSSQIKADKICRDPKGNQRTAHILVDFSPDHISIKSSTVIAGSSVESTSDVRWLGSSCAGAEE
jgi:hypothetical protein